MRGVPCVPNPDRSILASRHDPFPLRRVGQGSDVPSMSLERSDGRVAERWYVPYAAA